MTGRPQPPLVYIHYRRPPDRIDVFKQLLLFEDEGVRISFDPHLSLPGPKLIGGEVAMEPGSPVVWFTFPGAWHDIGLFHRADGTFTGLYANILTPPRFADRLNWHTTDLFLDLWIPTGGDLQVLDRDQFRAAVDRGAVTDREARGAEAEVARIQEAAQRGVWPPGIVLEWDLARARAQL